MRSYVIFALAVGLAIAAPTSKESNNDTVTVTKDLFVNDFKVYTAEHDIVSILVPLNSLNFDDDDDDSDSSEETNATIFFVEADINNGVKDYKGLSVFKNKQVKKILETGTDAAAANDDTKLAYFGATDGLYVYNEKENTAEKYGPITDSIISIAKVNNSDAIYILSNKNELFKVTENGTKKDLVREVVGAQQIVLDYSNNLYYYDADKNVFVYSEGAVKKIEGLPANPSYINLLKPPFIVENSIPVVLDNKSYIVYVNGSSETTDFEFAVRPSAYAMEATLIQYYAYEKSIYEYNVLMIILGGLLEELKEFFDSVGDEVQAIATRSRATLKT